MLQSFCDVFSIRLLVHGGAMMATEADERTSS